MQSYIELCVFAITKRIYFQKYMVLIYIFCIFILKFDYENLLMMKNCQNFDGFVFVLGAFADILLLYVCFMR